MDFSYLSENRDMLIAVAAAVSVFSAVLFATSPYIARDTLAIRMRQVANERERIRARERARLHGSRVALRSEPRRIFKQLVEKFNLAGQSDEGELVRTLRMAGYRGQAPVITFLALRLIAPFVLFVSALFYVYIVLKLQQPVGIKLAIAFGAGLLGYYGPALYVKNRIAKRQSAVRSAWPDALDLLLICVESGMGVEVAIRKVAEEIGPQSVELAEELSLTTAEMSYLQDRRQAYENLASRTGLEAVRSAVTSLIQAEKYGTPLGQALRVLAQESRDARMSMAEKKAAALPPKLTVPMILFFLPVLFAVITTPAAIQIMDLR